ncbi:MAG TPA: hypothetical protein VFB79_07000, partial [Candidatus Angelobacter sp.]|nr:hypothetical protein [Candidatus Angelobacter sp.]
MSSDSQISKDKSTPADLDGPIQEEIVREDQTGDAESAPALSEETAASAPTLKPASSPAFAQLKAYCDTHGIKSMIEVDPFECISLEFRNGRGTRTVLVGSEQSAARLLHVGLESIVFLADYSAICSYSEGWIEAAVRAHGVGSRRLIARRSIFGISATPPDEPAEKEIRTTSGLVLRLTEKRGVLSLLDYMAPIYL